MLEQKTDLMIAKLISKKTEIIEYYESCIDETESLYLFTWAPDPKEMPDSDFHIQNQVNVDLLANYLACCSCGIACVETSQLGNPHYHGWYQINPAQELGRIAMVKTINRYGILKISQASKYKIFNWNERGNALHYYKKDSVDAMLLTPASIITKDTKSICDIINFDLIGFFSKDRKVHRKIKEKIDNRDFYLDFYSNTLHQMDTIKREYDQEQQHMDAIRIAS